MNRKSYVVIGLIGIMLSVIGISIFYAIYQPNRTQTPIKIYRGLTEAEEELVKEYIKTAIEQQNNAKQQKAANPQRSSVNYASSQNEEFDNQTESMPPAPVAMQSENDVPDTTAPQLQKMLDEMQEHTNSLSPNANSLPLEFVEMIKDLESKGIDLGFDKGNAKKVIATLKVVGKNDNNIITVDKLSDLDIDENTWIEVKTDDAVIPK